MPTIAISGAGSGIGHTFLSYYSKDASNTIHAIDVKFPDEIVNRKAAAKLVTHQVNASDPSAVEKLVYEDLKDVPIDLFIHSAAIRGLVKGKVEEDKHNPGAAETLEAMDKETMMKTFEINIVGSFLLIRGLLPNLKLAEQGRVVVMSSRMGSLTANKEGSSYAYRASKAGLNAVIKSFSLDVPEIPFIIMHPGKVESRMVPNIREEGAVDPEEAVEEMLPIINGVGKKDTGKFLLKDGSEIPW